MRNFILLSIFFLNNLSVFAQENMDDFNLRFGKYTVGFNYYNMTDSTRTYTRYLDYSNESHLRNIPVSVWYPSPNYAIDNTGNEISNKRMSVLNYFRILAQEEEWDNLPDEHLLNWFWYIPNNAKNKKHLSLETQAILNVQPARGQFPVIIYAPSYQAASIENFAMCEYLASHGYVVIASPSRGTYNRKFEGGTARDMETQAADISFLIAHSYSLDNADTDRIGTFGFSFGGISNVLAQMKDNRIKATASLDGSIKYQFGTLEKSPFYNMERATVPFLHIAQKEIPDAVLKEDKIDPKLNTEFLFWDKLDKVDAYKFQMHDMAHSNFGAFSVLFEDRDKRQEKSDEKILISYGQSAEILKSFFDIYLKGNTGTSILTAYAKKDMISLETKEQAAQKLTVNDFIDDASSGNYTNLNALFERYRKQQPKFEIPEGVLNHKGLRLGFNPKTAEQGYRLFDFATKQYPTSSNLEDSWAEVYWANREFEKAKYHFEKSLQLNPENQNAISRLEQLSNHKR